MADSGTDLSQLSSGGASTEVDRQSLLWIAWKAFQKSESYANSVKWAAQPEHLEGSLWNMFSVGFLTATEAERKRCTAVVNAARHGEIDTDLRSIRSCIEDGYQPKDI